MGKNHSQVSDQASMLNENDWEQNTQFTEAMGSEIGYFKTYRNKKTQEMIDCYDVFFPSEKDYTDYLDNFRWRLDEPNIVNTKYFEPKILSQICSTTYQANVFIEHPKARLSDFKDIPCPDNLYCLATMLDGYGKLFDRIGRFPVSQDQISISENGKVRVWLNSDFSKNYPTQFQIQFKHQTAQQTQEIMVEEIVRMVALNTDQSSQPQVKFIQFFQKSRTHNVIGFEEAQTCIKEYAQTFNLKLTDYFESVVQIYNNEYNEEEDEHFHQNNQILQEQRQPKIQQQFITNRSSQQPVQSPHFPQPLFNAPVEPNQAGRIVQSPLPFQQHYSQKPLVIVRPSTQQSAPIYFQKPNQRRSSQGYLPLNHYVPPSPTKQRVKTHFNYFPSPSFINQRVHISPVQVKPIEKPLTEKLYKKERQFYHTVEDEIELDPEIAADMEKYI